MVITDIQSYGFLLLGFGVSSLLNSIPRAQRLKLSGVTLEWLFLTFNFILLLWNTSFTLNITAIVARAGTMSDAEIQSLLAWSNAFRIFALVGLGFLLGEIVFAVVRGLRNKKKQETEISISTQKLDSVTKEIEGYRKVLTDLREFFSKIEGKTPSKDDKRE